MDIRKRLREFERMQGTDDMDAMIVRVLINKYALENVVFGELKPNDKIPFERYVEDLNLQQHRPYLFRERIAGNFITKDERVADRDEDVFLMECFFFHIQNVFIACPDSNTAFGGVYGLSEFIMSLYPLFKQIIKTEVEIDPQAFEPVFKDRHDETVCYGNIARFLISINTRHLRQGRCVDRYVKQLPYIPYFVGRLLKKNKNRYLLANSNTDSLDYKLAILSAIHFMKFEHTKLFELKAQKWESNYQ